VKKVCNISETLYTKHLSFLYFTNCFYNNWIADSAFFVKIQTPYIHQTWSQIRVLIFLYIHM